MAIGRDIKRGNASNTVGGKRKRSSSKKKKGFLSATSLSVSNSNKLNKILEARRSKVSIVNSTIKDINKRTDRVIKGRVVKEFQFVTDQGKFVKKGI